MEPLEEQGLSNISEETRDRIEHWLQEFHDPESQVRKNFEKALQESQKDIEELQKKIYDSMRITEKDLQLIITI